jgi:Co/Zn/Cd efflux system component
MFLVETITGLRAGSVSLRGDSLDFLGDSANYAISLLVARMALGSRAKAAIGKGATMGLFGIWVLGSAAWNAVQRTPPEVVTMEDVGFAALAANTLCFVLLYSFRSGDSNMRSVWLCSRNDMIANCAVLVSAIGVAWTGTAWPDLVIAVIMGVLAIHGATAIVRQAHSELTGVPA